MKKITITIEEDDNYNIKTDNGWVGGVDMCATCPNRPGGPNNMSGFCCCTIPSMYGPYRITC